MLDATVAFPDVDLVVAPRSGPVRLAVHLDEEALVLEAFAAVLPRERFEITAEEKITARGGERFRESRISRQRLHGDGSRGDVEAVGVSHRRILAAGEKGRNCLTCEQETCRDRPNERLLTALRTTGPR